MADESQKKFREILEDFDMAMLVTATTDGQLRSRPMAIADVEDDGTLWFMTQSDSAKLDEIADDSHVNVSMQSSMKYLSISGTASPVKDRAKVAELWNELWKTWFPGGKDDPKLMLVKVTGNQGEYWDNSGTSGLKYLFEAGKAYMSGEKPDVAGDPDIHAKVKMHGSKRAQVWSQVW